MGRTNETATQLIRFQQQELAKFFSALRKADQEAFEDLFALAQFHIAPLAHALCDVAGAAQTDSASAESDPVSPGAARS
jgi:tRNA isopentenyl-2-thiomethyl-A-37 hydroxylase MiaE